MIYKIKSDDPDEVDVDDFCNIEFISNNEFTLTPLNLPDNKGKFTFSVATEEEIAKCIAKRLANES